MIRWLCPDKIWIDPVINESPIRILVKHVFAIIIILPKENIRHSIKISVLLL
jgi:hypothetical protein